MPLMQGKGKKAFQHNIKAEMHAGKPQDQSLAIAYSIKRKNAKKKASGGTVESGSKDMNMADGGSVSASNERRPMPDNTYDDSAMASRNKGNKPSKEDSWTDTPTERQAVSNNGRMVKPIKVPRMVPSNAFSVRLRDEEADLQSSKSPGPYDAKPPRQDDEEGPDRQGPQVPDMQDEHSTRRKPYAKGGQIEASDEHHPLDGKYEDDLLDLGPSEDEGSMMARSHDEMDADGQGDAISDMEDEHSTGMKPYASGGKIGDSQANIDDDMVLNPAHGMHSEDDSETQPESEEQEEHHSSITAAIMAKRAKLHAMIDSGAMDKDDAASHKMADGGEVMGTSDSMFDFVKSRKPSAMAIKSHNSIYSDDSDQADLSRNADEDANEEDQLSFNALRKENYSESAGLRQLDNPSDSGQHGDFEERDSEDQDDMISSIRRKMNKKQR